MDREDAFGNPMKPRFVTHPAMKKISVRDIRKQKDTRREIRVMVTSPQEAAWHAEQAARVAATNVAAARMAKDAAVVERALAKCG